MGLVPLGKRLEKALQPLPPCEAPRKILRPRTWSTSFQTRTFQNCEKETPVVWKFPSLRCHVTTAQWTKEFRCVTDRGRLPTCRHRAHSMVPLKSRSQRSRTCRPPRVLLGKLTPGHGLSFLTCAPLLPFFPPPDMFSPSCLPMLEFGSPLYGRGAPKEQGFAFLIASTLFYPSGIRRGLGECLPPCPGPSQNSTGVLILTVTQCDCAEPPAGCWIRNSSPPSVKCRGRSRLAILWEFEVKIK